MLKPLQHKRVKQGVDNSFSIKVEREEVSTMGIVDLYPIDLTGWKFWMYVHKHTDYCPENEVCKVVGFVPRPEDGVIIFVTCGCKIDVPCGMYWYTIKYESPNGKVYKTQSAKYEIVPSLHDYFSIYK